MEEIQTQEGIGIVYKIRKLILEYKRVVTVTKKPTKDEFITIVKVSALGIAAIGLLGFIVQMIEALVFK